MGQNDSILGVRLFFHDANSSHSPTRNVQFFCDFKALRGYDNIRKQIHTPKP